MVGAQGSVVELAPAQAGTQANIHGAPRVNARRPLVRHCHRRWRLSPRIMAGFSFWRVAELA